MKTELHPGDAFTISGVGYDRNGLLVINGRTIFGEQSKALQDAVWVVSAEGGELAALPSSRARHGRMSRKAVAAYGPAKRKRW